MDTDSGEAKIEVQCTDRLKKAVRVAAAESDVSMAQYVREVLADETGALEA